MVGDNYATQEWGQGAAEDEEEGTYRHDIGRLVGGAGAESEFKRGFHLRMLLATSSAFAIAPCQVCLD
jgi:hypothetical protein